MKNQEDLEQLLKLIDKYEESLQQCTLQEFRELRYQLKQVKEKLSSLKKQYGNPEVAINAGNRVN
jgi:prefoldin subunit 5